MNQKRINNCVLMCNAAKQLLNERIEFLNSEDYNFAKKNLNDIGFCKECLTFKISLPRRLGKSTIASTILQSFKNVVLMCLTQTHCDAFENVEGNQVIQTKNFMHVKCAKIVVIDDSFLVSKSLMRLIYTHFGCNTIYLLLG